MLNKHEVEEAWTKLDPIFIMGRQRTGTSIMWRALRVANFLGFPEGHLWLDLIESFLDFRNPDYEKWLRQDIFTLGSKRNLWLEKRFALMVDQFHRDFLSSNLVRWVNKSPGVKTVLLAPILADIFPQSQFIFMKRNAITTVDSTINYISKVNDLEVFRTTCTNWVTVMRIWRRVRHLLERRYIEINQEDIAKSPSAVALKVANFLRSPDFSNSLADVFESKRENTAFPNKSVGEYIYPVNWTHEQKAVFTDICRDEMAVWGYPLNFQCPEGAVKAQVVSNCGSKMDKLEYYRWARHTLAKNETKKLAQCEEQLARIKEGRVMRVLNTISRIASQMGLRW
jgi:hypothetical protein